MKSPAQQPKITIDDIDAGVPAVESKRTPDVNDQFEIEQLEAVKLRNELSRSVIKNVEADREMRKDYAKRILCYLEVYSVSVGAIILCSGFKVLNFILPIEVLAALVGSTAVAAIGLVGFIAKGLFQAPPGKQD